MIKERLYSIQSKLSLVFLIAIIIIGCGGFLSFYSSNQLLMSTRLFVDTTLPRIETANSLHRTAHEIRNETKDLTRTGKWDGLRPTFVKIASLLDRLEKLTAKITQQDPEIDILSLNLISQAIRSQAQLVFQLEAQLVKLKETLQDNRQQVRLELIQLPTLGHNEQELFAPARQKHDQMHEYIGVLLSHLNRMENVENLADLDALQKLYEENRAGFQKVVELADPHSTEEDPKHETSSTLKNIDRLFNLQRQYFRIKTNISAFIDELNELVNQLTLQTNTYVEKVFNQFRGNALKVIKREKHSLYLTFGLLVFSIFFFYILYRRIVIDGFGNRLSIISRAMGTDPGEDEGVNLPVQGRDEIANMARAAEELLDKARKLKELATMDSLTQVYNRRFFFDLAAQEVNRVKRNTTPTVLLMLDIDYFKSVNDNYGHAFGDKVLYETAQTCLHCVRSIDLFARYGGEEFVVLMPQTNLEKGRIVSERIRAAVAGMDMLSDEGARVEITMSIGMVETQLAETTVDQALKEADNALYRAKQLGRNRVEVGGKIEVQEID
ncbi:diguanylate cyclase [Desulfosediminicola flagellatus]|uniref:diguanylate cyclase n=1 Tax=Desulfosediminicola flagellatus TaxID=2569541 RepID=UPI0010AB9181|nr:diguanylate cyclase [Desulfosediminicola flagellatus]